MSQGNDTDQRIAILCAAVDAALVNLHSDAPQLQEIHKAMAAECRKHYPGMAIPKGLLESTDYIKSFEFEFEGLRPKVTWLRKDDTIELAFEAGDCACPLVRSGLLAPNPNLCGCSCIFLETQFYDATGLNAKVKVLKSVCRGNNKCVWQYSIYPKL